MVMYQKIISNQIRQRIPCNNCIYISQRIIRNTIKINQNKTPGNGHSHPVSSPHAMRLISQRCEPFTGECSGSPTHVVHNPVATTAHRSLVEDTAKERAHSALSCTFLGVNCSHV